MAASRAENCGWSATCARAPAPGVNASVQESDASAMHTTARAACLLGDTAEGRTRKIRKTEEWPRTLLECTDRVNRQQRAAFVCDGRCCRAAPCAVPFACCLLSPRAHAPIWSVLPH